MLFRSVFGLSSSATNKNPNMYIINVSKLNEFTQNYFIGDPRTLYPDNNLNNTRNNRLIPPESDSQTYAGTWCAQVNSLFYGGDIPRNRRLRWYYPTKETSETRLMIAPKFRIASSYGVVNSGQSLENLRKRCATYQEDNCPAGRWRLPTFAEIEFIVNLSRNTIIPILFSSGAYYLSAQGYVYINPNEGSQLTTK